MSKPWHVHKFGGTSVRDADRYRSVGRIVIDAGDKQAVVVSAMAGVTDHLLDILERAKNRDSTYRERFADLLARHRETVMELLRQEDKGDRLEILDGFEKDVKDIEDVLRSTWLLKTASEETTAWVSGHGELWSARILGAHLHSRGKNVRVIDARDVLVVEHESNGPVIHWKTSQALVDTMLKSDQSDILVITGYVASHPDGTPATLGRNGSDLSASVFGALLDAERITIWTDVDGVLSADPRRVPEALVTPVLSYDEAAELAYFGAKVLHPHTMAPAIAKSIPIAIKNTFAPDAAGSLICADAGERVDTKTAGPVRGFASVDDIALINVEGTGMLGVVGVSERLFRALRDENVNVILISQASSEHSISVAVPWAEGDRAIVALERAFYAEREHGQIDAIQKTGPCAILAAVGDKMAETPGVSGRFCAALGQAGVNIRAMAQGSSERNVSVVIDQADVTRGLRAVHAAFTLSDQTLSVGLVGPGLIGQALLAQFDAQRQELHERFGVDIRVRAIANSRTMLLDDKGIDLENWVELLNEGEAADLEKLAAHVNAEHIPHAVIIDCTASDAVAQNTARWLEQGIHVLTPNKKACSGDKALYAEIQKARADKGTHFFYEATVGAGLPILSTLRDLVKTGDDVVRIEGIFSGTLSYLFNTYDGQGAFSELVKDARAKGYTEPDPRDDLSGMDVARKVVTLAREMGADVSLDDVEIESLVPEALRSVDSAEAFLDGLPAHDDAMKALFEKADQEGGVLRYVGKVDPKKGCTVSLEVYPKSHAFAGLSGSDNIIAFTTSRYRDQPLIVRGPGAGPRSPRRGVQ